MIPVTDEEKYILYVFQTLINHYNLNQYISIENENWIYRPYIEKVTDCESGEQSYAIMIRDERGSFIDDLYSDLSETIKEMLIFIPEEFQNVFLEEFQKIISMNREDGDKYNRVEKTFQ